MPPRRVAALALVALLGAGCSTGGGPFLDARGSGGAGTATTSPGSPTPSPPGGTAACPASYVPPDPKRPHITLTFDLAEDLATVRGTEKVTFTPDLPIRELVFRISE